MRLKKDSFLLLSMIDLVLEDIDQEIQKIYCLQDHFLDVMSN